MHISSRVFTESARAESASLELSATTGQDAVIAQGDDTVRRRRLPDTSAGALEDPVFAERIEMLYARLPVALAGSSTVAGLLVAVLWAEEHPRVPLGWLVLFLGLAALRWAIWKRRRTRPEARTAKGWARLFVAGTALSGRVWGIGVAWMFEPSGLPLLVVLAFATGGLCAGASTTASSYEPAAAAFILPAALPLAVRLVAELGPTQIGMGIMVATFAIVLVVLGRTSERSVAEQVQLRLDREALARRLDAALRELSSCRIWTVWSCSAA